MFETIVGNGGFVEGFGIYKMPLLVDYWVLSNILRNTALYRTK